MGDFGIGALIGGGMSAIGSIFGASESSSGYEAAADTSAASQAAANRLTWDMYQQNRADYAPFLASGTRAINQLSSLTAPGGKLYNTNFTYSDLYADPSYNWVKEQGINSLAAKSAAAGNYGSGNLGTALVDYGTNLASTEYGNAWNRWLEGNNALYNRLAGIAGIGQTAASGVTSSGTNAANSMSSNLLNTASNVAASQIGQANTWANAISGIGNLGGNMMNQYMMYNLLGLV